MPLCKHAVLWLRVVRGGRRSAGESHITAITEIVSLHLRFSGCCQHCMLHLTSANCTNLIGIKNIRCKFTIKNLANILACITLGNNDYHNDEFIMTYHHLYTLFSYHIQTDTHASTLKIYILYDVHHYPVGQLFSS